jgi:Gram-negative bacterial TonB protein C-terminal
VTDTLRLDDTIKLKVIGLHSLPKLLVEWSSPWEEFVTSIRPALARSPARLAGEAPHGIFPYRGMLTSWVVESLLLLAAIFLPARLARMRPYVPPQLPTYDVLYYSGDELPRTEDLGGAKAGGSGRAGGKQAHHRSQTIRVARGGSLAPRVVDAPDLKLPSSAGAVANLLAIKPTPGPPPAEGLHSSLTLPSLPTSVIAPAPRVARDRTLSPPALSLPVIPPSPSVSGDRALIAPALTSGIVAPAPGNVSHDKARSAPAFNGSIIPPAPPAVSREGSRAPVQMANAAVVPPPVSAPERESVRDPKLSLPAPSVIAPPPSTEISRDLHSLASGGLPEPSKAVIPPPAQVAGGGFMSSLLGKLIGTTDVVPPPPSVGGNNNSATNRSALGGMVSSSATNIVPPPPSVAGAAMGAVRSTLGGAKGSSPGASVVPPPPSVPGSGTGRDSAASSGANGSGTLSDGNVVPPPPSLTAGSGLSSSGRGARGTGLGGPLDAGSVLAPPSGGGGSGGGSGIVVSNRPGPKLGLPGSSAGSLALSPAGGDKPGVGGGGGGSGIGHGEGSGSGMTGEGSGAARAGAGRGSDPNARGGISPSIGPGGTGNSPGGTPAVPGVSVSGGSTMVTLPSFGSDSSSGSNLPPRSSVKQQQGPAITVQATSRSGGAFNFYGKLPGDNYTVYIDTSLGTVVMQFADASSAGHPFSGSLIGPQGLRTDLPAGLPRSRIVIACILDASGNLKSLRVDEPGPPLMTAKVMAALQSWKFRPAMRGGQPVEVNALLGFGIDTNDRN